MQDWSIVEPNDIRKIFRKLGQAEKDQYRAAISTLSSSERPENHGRFKRSLKCYAYEITKSYRILYEVDRISRTISILDVDDHKGVYGKDC